MRIILMLSSFFWYLQSDPNRAGHIQYMGEVNFSFRVSPRNISSDLNVAFVFTLQKVMAYAISRLMQDAITIMPEIIY